MSYPVKIGVTSNGTPRIGAKSMDGDDMIATEKVFGVQLSHRVVWWCNHQWWLGTPTEMRADRAAGKTVRWVCRITGWQSVSEADQMAAIAEDCAVA